MGRKRGSKLDSYADYLPTHGGDDTNGSVGGGDNDLSVPAAAASSSSSSTSTSRSTTATSTASKQQHTDDTSDLMSLLGALADKPTDSDAAPTDLDLPSSTHSSIMDFFNPPASPVNKSPSGTVSYDEFMANMMGGIPKTRGRVPDSDEISRRQQSRAERLLRNYAVRQDTNRAGLRRAKKKAVKFGKNKGGGYQMEVRSFSTRLSELVIYRNSFCAFSLSGSGSVGYTFCIVSI
jgi:hypothetical protein